VVAVSLAGPHTFHVAWRVSGAAGPVAAAIEEVLARSADAKQVVPLVAVPFMGPAGRERCTDAGVSWLDLSGNARIVAPGLHVLVEGQPNRYRTRGRPSSAFAPKSSRLARWLLMHPGKSWSQREIAEATGLDEGYTSKVARKLVDEGLVDRDVAGTIAPRDPDLLLDAWREAYDFEKHHLIQGHVAARDGEASLRQLARALKKQSLAWAATGLAGAWLLDRFAAFRITTLYLAEEPPADLLEALAFREEERGANVWLVVPNDEGVFLGASSPGGIRCAHPVQVYLDLLAHPERAGEAAEHLRETHMTWRSDD
jgi:hypothetical protein